MVICLIALGAMWVVLNPAPVVQTAKEPPAKKTLAYHDAMAARDQEIDQREAEKAEPSSVEDILADDEAQTASSQDGTGEDMAALSDDAAEPLPWANPQPGVVQPAQPQAPPQAGPGGQNPYGSGGQNPYAPGGQNPYAANVPGNQNAYGQNPPADPYGAPPGQAAYPGQDPYGQDPYGQDPYGQGQYGQEQYGQEQYGQEAYGDPDAPHGRDPYSQDPYGSDGQPGYDGQGAYPGHDPFADPPPYPGQGQPPYPGQQQAALPPGAPPQYPVHAPQGAADGEWVRVISSGTGMRNTASEDSPILFAFPYGRNLKVVSRNGEWVEVSDPNSSAKGWMLSHNLAPTSNPYAQPQPYFEEPKEERRGLFRNFLNRAFGN